MVPSANKINVDNTAMKYEVHEAFFSDAPKGPNMKMNFKQQVTKDTFYAVEPLNRLLVVFNLSCVYRKDNKLVVSCSYLRNFIHVFIFGAVNFFFLFHKINRLDGVRRHTIVKFSDSIQMTYLLGYFMHIMDLFQVYKYGREKYLKYYEVFDSIDKILGMKNYDDIRKLVLTIVTISSVISFSSAVFDYFAWVEGFGFILPSLYSLDYFFFFLNILTLFDGMGHLVQLEFRLKMMRNLLRDYYTSNGIKSIDDDKIIAVQSGKYVNRLESLQSLSHNRYIEAIDFNRCYLLLLDQAKYINRKFGFRVVAFCINSLVNMITLINIAIRLVVGTMITPFGAVYLPAISSVIRFLNWAIINFIVSYRAEKTYRQSEDVLNMIDLILVNKNNSNKLKVTLTELRNLIVTRPIKYHAAYFFNLDFTILVSVASVVVTYTIIMLQSMQ